MHLKLIKTTVEIGLYNLPLSFPACACQDLEIHMYDTQTTLVDSLQGALDGLLEKYFHLLSTNSSSHSVQRRQPLSHPPHG